MSGTETEKRENGAETPEKAGGDDAPMPSVTIERVADTALGALVSAAEALEAAFKLVQENGPAVAEAFERKGRPVRERIVEALRGTPFAAPTSPGPSATSAGAPKSGESAAVEISALERRVRELEAQIAGGDLQITETTTAETPSKETTADAATFNGEIWETPEERDFLADSPYAVSETPEERIKEDRESEAAGGENADEEKAR